jgi:DNA-binding NtrC family response regulator
MRVLVVEDHDSQRALYAEALQEAGHEVVAVASVREVVHHPGVLVPRPDVLVLDHTLGDGTHEDVVRLLPGVRYLVVSGAPPPEHFIGCWLCKPVSGRQLAQCVRHFLSEQREGGGR